MRNVVLCMVNRSPVDIICYSIKTPNQKAQSSILNTMKTSIKSLSLVTGILVTIAFILLCATANADLVNKTATAYSTGGSWATDPGGNTPFYSTANLAVFGNFSQHGQPAPATGAPGSLLAETITISNNCGNIGLSSSLISGTNYVLTGISLLVSGNDATYPVSVHIFDVTTNLTGGLLSSTATYNFTANGDLLGGGSGLSWTNNQLSGAEQQVYLGLQNGPLTQDQIVLASNHTYAVEIWVPSSGATFYWWKSSAAPQDTGGWFRVIIQAWPCHGWPRTHPLLVLPAAAITLGPSLFTGIPPTPPPLSITPPMPLVDSPLSLINSIRSVTAHEHLCRHERLLPWPDYQYLGQLVWQRVHQSCVGSHQ